MTSEERKEITQLVETLNSIAYRLQHLATKDEGLDIGTAASGAFSARNHLRQYLEETEPS